MGDSDFIIYLWDGVHYGQKNSFLLKEFKNLGIDIRKIPPIFAFTVNKKAEDRKNFILFPDSLTIDISLFNKLGWVCLNTKISNANSKSKWESKKDIAFWRGGDAFSHRDYNKRNFAVELSRKYPKLLDVKFTLTLKDSKSFFERKLKYAYKFFSIDPWVSFTKYIEHKMLLDLEGNTVSYPAIYWKLFSNSVVLKQVTNNEIWASDQFIPWLHFVPVKEDLKDLIEKINWVKEHDAHAKQIAATSDDFMKKNLMPKHFDMYIYHLLNEYSKRFNHKPKMNK